MQKFSQQLDDWLASNKRKTIAGLIKMSEEKSFAVIFLVLMAIPALPIPTGGITHIFEVIVMLLALELIAGRSTIWLPNKWLKRPLGKTLVTRSLPYLSKKIKWLEKHSRPRWSGLLERKTFLRLIGLVVMILTVGAFLSPPFSGLDTLPALGVVGISLGLILEDFALIIFGFVVGSVGILIEVSLGTAITNFIASMF